MIQAMIARWIRSLMYGGIKNGHQVPPRFQCDFCPAPAVEYVPLGAFGDSGELVETMHGPVGMARMCERHRAKGHRLLAKHKYPARWRLMRPDGPPPS